MSGAQQKIECLRNFLLEELEIGQESSKDTNLRARSFADDGVCQKCDLTFSQLRGILDGFKKEGFILSYRGEPMYSSVTPLVESGSYATSVTFPASLPEGNTNNAHDNDVYAYVTFDPKSREVLYDGKYRMAQPRFESPSHQFIEHLFKNPNVSISTEELRKYVKPDAGPYSGPNQFLTDLGFTGSFRKMFFPGASVRGVIFRDRISKVEFKKLGISSKQLATALERLRNKRK